MHIRAATPEDALEVARVHVRAWQAGYRDLLPHGYLECLRPEARAQRYNFSNEDIQHPATLVAEEDRICGFATTMATRSPDLPEHGELCALYVDPAEWGKGIGKALLTAAASRLAQQGFKHAVLWLLNGNQRAERFYRNDGWKPDGLTRVEAVWGIAVTQTRYRRGLSRQS